MDRETLEIPGLPEGWEDPTAWRDPAVFQEFRRLCERARKLALLAESHFGELPYVEEMLSRLGKSYDDLDLKVALAEMFRRGWYAYDQRRADKVFAGLPADAPLSQILRRLRIPMREDRSIPSPVAVTKIRRALTDKTFRSMRSLAQAASIDESTLRKVLRNESADLETWQKIARALGIPVKTLLSA
jgi:lambda repressor-like predicted transcriptional regulator